MRDYYLPVALDQITVDATVGGVPLTSANTAGARRAVVYVETASIRFSTVPGTIPTSSVGILANAGDTITLSVGEIGSFKAIRTTGVSALLTVEYSK